MHDPNRPEIISKEALKRTDRMLPGESLIWHGKPRRYFRFNVRTSLRLIGILAFALILYEWETAFGWFFLLLLVLSGIAAVNDFLADRRTWYGLTNQRLMRVEHKLLGGTFQAMPLLSLNELTLTTLPGGLGTIVGKTLVSPAAAEKPVREDSPNEIVLQKIELPEMVRALISEAHAIALNSARSNVNLLPGNRALLTQETLLETGTSLPGEHVLWQGKPSKPFELSFHDLLYSLIFLPLMLLPLYVLYLAMETRNPRNELQPIDDRSLYLLIIALGCLMGYGLYGFILRHLINRYRWSNTFYLLNQWRATVYDPTSMEGISRYRLDAIKGFSLEQHGNGTGTIFMTLLPTPLQGAVEKPLFRYIPDAEIVLELLENARADFVPAVFRGIPPPPFDEIPRSQSSR